MNAKEINENALNSLKKQQWLTAQKMFFLNARVFPSHNSYNNLGVFLITEGLTCKNGRTRNANKLGLSYLLRASSLGETQVNFCAISKAYDYEQRYCSDERRAELLNQSGCVLAKALEISYNHQVHYNLLRIKCLQSARTYDLLDEVRALAYASICQETIKLYFELLRKYNLRDEGLRCIKEYGEYLDEIELLMFYTSMQMYDKGYSLCEQILGEYSPDKFIASAVLECCINTHRLIDAELYAGEIKKRADSTDYRGKDKWGKNVLSNLNSTSEYRRWLISNYSNIPPMIDMCYYFGCQIHRLDW